MIQKPGINAWHRSSLVDSSLMYFLVPRVSYIPMHHVVMLPDSLVSPQAALGRESSSSAREYVCHRLVSEDFLQERVYLRTAKCRHESASSPLDIRSLRMSLLLASTWPRCCVPSSTPPSLWFGRSSPGAKILYGINLAGIGSGMLMQCSCAEYSNEHAAQHSSREVEVVEVFLPVVG